MFSLAKSNTTSAGRKYVVRTMAFMGGYTAVNVAAIFGAFDEIIGKPVAWALALAVAAPVAGQIWATLSLMRESAFSSVRADTWLGVARSTVVCGLEALATA